MDESDLIKELEEVLARELKRRKQNDARYGIYKIAFRMAIELLRMLIEKRTHKNKKGAKPSEQ